MKTLHFTNSWHTSSGGIATFYKALFTAAEREKHQMRLVVPSDCSRVEERGEFGRIYHIEAPRAPLYPEYRMLYPTRFLFPRTAVQRILNDERPDLVEVSEKYVTPYLAGLLRTSRLPGVKHRPTVIGLSHERMDENMAAYITGHPFGRRFCTWYMKWIYFPMFDHHITVSEHTAGELIDASRGHKVSRGVWISPMGVDCERFTPSRRTPENRERLLQLARGFGQPIHPDATVLLYAGRLAPEKNLPLLLDTMQRLDAGEYRLCIIGDGIEFTPLRDACAQRGIGNIVFAGQIGDRDILAGHFAAADVFIHPNPREPFGIAPLEAMASGLALVAPDSGGVTSYANETNAWLSAADPEAFAASVRSIRHGSAELLRSRTAAGRRTAEAHGWCGVASRYLSLYRELDAVTRGNLTTFTHSPRAYSTKGNAFGRELTGL